MCKVKMKITDNAGKRKFISDWNRSVVPSVLWRCWLGGRKGNRPVKNWVVRCWRGYLSGARCRLAYAQLMPLPLTVSCFSKIQIGFTFLVPAHLGSSGKRAVKRVWVCVESFCTGGQGREPMRVHCEDINTPAKACTTWWWQTLFQQPVFCCVT